MDKETFAIKAPIIVPFFISQKFLTGGQIF